MPTILIIDDDPATCDLVKFILKPLEVEVIAQRGVNDVFVLVDETQPDAIIMDLFLPEPSIDGWTATQLLKDNEQTRHIPVIVLSAAGSARDEERAFRVGCDVFLRKPVHPHDLRDYLSTYLS